MATIVTLDPTWRTLDVTQTSYYEGYPNYGITLGVRVKRWTDSGVKTETIKVEGTVSTDVLVLPAPTATPEDRRLAANWDKATSFMERVKDYAREAYGKIGPGTEVEIVRGGRRFPSGKFVAKGTPRGGTVNVEHATLKGVAFDHVPVSYLKVTPDFRQAIPSLYNEHYQDELKGIIAACTESGCTEMGWKLIAEFVEEKEISPHDLPGYAHLPGDSCDLVSPAWFAEMIRRVTTEGDPLFNKDWLAPVPAPADPTKPSSIYRRGRRRSR